MFSIIQRQLFCIFHHSDVNTGTCTHTHAHTQFCLYSAENKIIPCCCGIDIAIDMPICLFPLKVYEMYMCFCLSVRTTRRHLKWLGLLAKGADYVDLC